MKLYSIEQAANIAKCAKITAQVWAKKNGISIIGNSFVLTEVQLKAFLNRNKKRGRPAIA